MASVDDLDELIATRRLNGLDDGLFKESNIEEDIKILEDENQIIYDFTTRKIDNKWKKAYKNIIDFSKNALVEREQNKKRIKELDADLTTAYLKGYADAEEKYREKIKEKRDEINKKYEDSKDENGESPYYYPEYTIKVLEKLLEEKNNEIRNRKQ